MWLKALGVFLSMTIVDFSWAVYVKAVADERIVLAGVYAMVIVFFGAFTAISYVEDKWMLVPAMAGAFVGTLMSIAFTKRVPK